MRVMLIAAGLLLPTTALAQGSLMDMGKGLLQQQIQQQMPSTPGSGSGGTHSASLSSTDITSGLKDALRQGANAVTDRLGRADGFNADPKVHIPLPDTLRTVQSGLKLAGLSGVTDELEVKLNRAAEAATPQARRIFTDALERMSVDDARGILNGPSDSATQYFKRTMTPDLKTALRPIVDRTVGEAGAVQSYEALASSAKGMPLVGDGRTMLTDHVMDYALAGIFRYLADEEAAIRSNPAKRTTDLMRKVFAN
ncbi:MAG TPA: DUF4197 domain-containing protein [Magnetospirillum sp.]|jgi:hypothetical protein|nr:DUF4197 domain-containing protein [Magnetospirillum sp.]